MLMFVLIVAYLLSKPWCAGSAPLRSTNCDANSSLKFDEQVKQPATFHASHHMKPQEFTLDVISVALLLYNDPMTVLHRYNQDQRI